MVKGTSASAPPDECQNGAVSASPVRSVVRNALDGRLPERYQAGAAQWRHLFDIHAREAYRPGMDVLDVGAGRKPSLPRDMRSGGGRYVGLDIDPSELGRAVDGAYEETLAADICVFQPELEGCFDLALSLFLLEHVHSVPAAVENVWRYLRPGGKVVAQLAGARSLHGLVNRAIPHRLARQIAYRAMRKSTLRAEDSIFPAHYDHCTPSQLQPLLAGWSNFW